MEKIQNRRNFIKTTAIAGLGLSLSGSVPSIYTKHNTANKKRVGIIGLDTSHVVAFTKTLNDQSAGSEFAGYMVVAAYPTEGSADLPASINRLEGFTETIRNMGVKIVNSIEELVEKVDFVLLESVDGRRHLAEALPVLKAGKPMFVDKPFTASLSDAIILSDKAKQSEVPIWSSSSLRYMKDAQSVARGNLGKVLGAFTYSPAEIQETHPDLFWYGIHGIEILYTIMGIGCQSVERVYTSETDLVTGIWQDSRIAAFRGLREGKYDYGGLAFGKKDNMTLGGYQGYKPLLKEIVKFFETGKPPVKLEDTMEMLAFMEAADESKRLGGASVKLGKIWERAKEEASKKEKYIKFNY